MQTEIFERMEHRNKTTNNSFPKSTYTIIKPQQNTSFELELRNCVEQIKDLSEKTLQYEKALQSLLEQTASGAHHRNDRFQRLL